MLFKSFKLSLLLIIFLSLVGCGGFFPAYRNLDGQIENGTYTTKIGKTGEEGSFRVVMPHTPGSYEYSYMKSKEQFNKYGTYLSFGPAAIDHTIFRIYVDPPEVPITPKFLDQAIDASKQEAEHAYKAKLKQIAYTSTTVNGRSAKYAVYTQSIPGYTDIQLHQIAATTYTHAIYAIDYGKYFVSIWIQYSNNSTGENQINNTNRDLITKRTHKKQNDFVRSFKIIN